MNNIAELTCIWLAGLISTDGTVEIQGKRARRYRVYSSELHWLQLIQNKLSEIGIGSTIELYKPNDWRLNIHQPKIVTKLLLQYGKGWTIPRKWKRIQTAYKPSAELDLNKLIEDPVYFIETLFPIKLFDYQKQIMQILMTKEFTMVLKGRQIGLSWTAACFALYWASTHANNHILVLALYRKQAQRILEYVKQILFMQPQILEQLVEMPYGLTKSEIRFLNGSIIEISGVTRPHGDNVRSKHAHLLIVDEAVLLFDRQMSAIEPITAFTKGKRFYISTAGFTGCFFHRKFEHIRQRKPANSAALTLPACKLENGKITNILCPAQTKERLREAMQDLGTINFRREYLCEWLGAENQMFPVIFKTPTETGKKIQPEKIYYAGLDVGEVTNPTVLVLIQGTKQLAVAKRTWEWRSRLYRTKKSLARAITKVLKPYNIRLLRMDKTGIGLGLYERLIDEGAPIDGVSWNKIVKNRLMFNLRDALNAPKLYINANLEQLLYELRGYFAEPIEGSNYFEFKYISSDDYVDALALAWDAIPEAWEPPPTKIVAREPRLMEHRPDFFSWRRLCIKCGRLLHVLDSECPKCGTEQPSWRRK